MTEREMIQSRFAKDISKFRNQEFCSCTGVLLLHVQADESVNSYNVAFNNIMSKILMH